MKKRDEKVDLNTGVVSEHKLNEMILHETKRPDGTVRIRYDFTYCPSMTEQHLAHMTDLNYLMEKYKPDEIAAYIAARSSYRQEILGHDFSLEPSMQDAKQIVYDAKQIYENLDPDVKDQFSSPLAFIKFIDNPKNAEKMYKLGILKRKDIEKLNGDSNMETGESKRATQRTTQEDAKE